MSLSIRNGGAFSTVKQVWVRDGGLWKPAKAVSVRDGGQFKSAFASSSFTAVRTSFWSPSSTSVLYNMSWANGGGQSWNLHLWTGSPGPNSASGFNMGPNAAVGSLNGVLVQLTLDEGTPMTWAMSLPGQTLNPFYTVPFLWPG